MAQQPRDKVNNSSDKARKASIWQVPLPRLEIKSLVLRHIQRVKPLIPGVSANTT